jgi:hypothetical protein
MSYDVKNNTITVNGVKYDVVREDDRGHPETTLTIRDFDVKTDDWIFPFPGLSGTLGYDEDPGYANPRTDDAASVGIMACYHPRYNLGDGTDPRDFLENEKECDQCEGTGTYPPMGSKQFEQPEQTPPLNMPDEDHPTCEKCDGSGYLTVKLADWIRQEYGARVIVPLFLYDHSGISMSTGEPIIARSDEVGDFDRRNRAAFDAAGWDVSSIGVMFDTPEGVETCIGKDATVEQIVAAINDEVKHYSSYLEGDVTYWVVTDDETNYHESCSGYVGDHDECERECFHSLEAAIAKRLGEEAEREHWRNRDVETR